MDQSKISVKMVDFFDSHWYRIDVLNLEGKLETRWFASVTQKLGIMDKPYLARWRGDLGNRECDMRLFEAQERGSRIHNAWHMLCMGGRVIFNPWQRPNYSSNEIEALKQSEPFLAVVGYQDEMLDVMKLKELVNRVKPKMIFSEKIVYSLKNNDAGTADNAWHIKEGKYFINGAKPLSIPEGKYLIDLKTGNQVSKEAKYQVAAYVHCDEEMGSESYAGTMIIHTKAATRSGIEGLGVTIYSREEVNDHYKTYRMIADLWEKENKEAMPKVFEFPTMITL